MLLSIYKWLCYFGIALLIVFVICEAALASDKTGLHFDFGVGVEIFLGILTLAIFTYFLLPLFYIRFRNQKLFICILITGIVAMLFPGLGFWETITRWFEPEHIDFSGVFKTSAFRTNVNRIENVIVPCVFICQLAIFILTIRLKYLWMSIKVL